MRGRRYCDKAEGVFPWHTPDLGRGNPERTRAKCSKCGAPLVKDVDGAWWEPVAPTWYLWAAIWLIAAAVLALAFAWWTTP